MSEPETLIQSQQVTITGTDDRIANVLQIMKMYQHKWNVTVTLTPTSVPDATVGVTEQSQQNPRQDGEA